MNSNGFSDQEKQNFKEMMMVEAVRVVTSCFAFSGTPEFQETMKKYKIP